MFLKIFESHKRRKISTKSNDLSCNTSGSQLRMFKMRLSYDPTNNNEYIKKSKLQTILRHRTVQINIFIRR